MCILSLFGEFNRKTQVLQGVQVGMTGYLDMVDPEHFKACKYPEMALRGTDRSGRMFYSFFLTIEEKKKHDMYSKWKKTDCIYTFFQRYSGRSKKVVLCTSHLKPDYSHVFHRALKTKGNPSVVEECEETFFQEVFKTLLKGGVFESEATEYTYPGQGDLEPTETEMIFRVRVFKPRNI